MSYRTSTSNAWKIGPAPGWPHLPGGVTLADMLDRIAGQETTPADAESLCMALVGLLVSLQRARNMLLAMGANVNELAGHESALSELGRWALKNSADYREYVHRIEGGQG